MHGQSSTGGQPSRLLLSGLFDRRLDRRDLLRAAAILGAGASLGFNRRRAAAQAAAGAATSPARDAVMQQILAAYPLERDGVPRGGTVVVGDSTDLETVNPLLATSAPTLPLLGLVFEGLVGTHPVDGSIIPALADYEIGADQVTYTFRIHPDARFHDGAPVTAADVAFCLDAILSPDFLSPYASGIQAVLASYRVVDDKTFEMVSNGPIASFLFDAVLPIIVLPKRLWEGVPLADWPSDTGSTGEDAARVVGTGPFKFVEWVQGDHATLERNEDYWDRMLNQAPNLDRFVFQVLPDLQTAVQALAVGDVDAVLSVPPQEFERVTATEGRTISSYSTLGFTYYAYQLDPNRSPLFQDQAVRQALFVALDRQGMIDAFQNGQGEVALGPHAPLSPAYAPAEFDPYAYDPERARALLAEAGWTDADGDGIVEKDGQRLSFTMLSFTGDATIGLTVAYMQEAWAEIGVEMTPELLPFNSLLDRMIGGDFEMFLLGFGWSADPGQGAMFATGGGFNVSGYSNPEYDRLEEEQLRTLDPERRLELILEQAKIVWEDLPVGILAFNVLGLGHDERLKNVYPNGYSSLWSAPFWYLAAD